MRLKVGEEFLDQYDNTDIAQTFTVSPLGKIETRAGGFSNKFKLPLTAKNSDLLEYPADFNSTNRSPYIKFDVSLVDVGAVIARGYLKFTIVDNIEQELQCTFYEGNTDWINPLKDKKLKDLNLEEWSHTWNGAAMKANIDSDPTEGYCYPVINYGLSTGSTTYTVIDKFMFPGMFVHTVLRSIFNEVNWRIDGELLDLFLYKRMIIPFSDSDFVKPPSAVASDEFEPWDAITPMVNLTLNTLSISATTTFQPSTDGNYNITVTINIDITANATGLTITCILLKGASPIKTILPTYAAGDTGLKTITLSVSTQTIDVPADLYSVTAQLLTFTTATVNLLNSGGINFFESSTYVINDIIKNMADTLPNISQVDFLKYIFFSFGVVPQPNNETKTLTLDLFRSLKDNLDNAVDWSDKLDLSKKSNTDFTQLLNNYGSISAIKYKEDANDSNLIEYKNETAQTFGDGQFDIDNEFISQLKTIYTAPFSSFTNTFSWDDVVYAATIAFLDPADVSGNTRFSMSPKIAIMTPNETVLEITGGPAGYTVFTITSTPNPDVTMSSVPITFFSKENISSVFDKYNDSLAFDQIQLQNYSGFTLIDQFLIDYEVIFSNMRYLKAFFHLTEVDINELDFTLPVYIERYKGYFYISKIKNYRGSGLSTECELVKIS